MKYKTTDLFVTNTNQHLTEIEVNGKDPIKKIEYLFDQLFQFERIGHEEGHDNLGLARLFETISFDQIETYQLEYLGIVEMDSSKYHSAEEKIAIWKHQRAKIGKLISLNNPVALKYRDKVESIRAKWIEYCEDRIIDLEYRDVPLEKIRPKNIPENDFSNFTQKEGERDPKFTNVRIAMFMKYIIEEAKFSPTRTAFGKVFHRMTGANEDNLRKLYAQPFNKRTSEKEDDDIKFVLEQLHELKIEVSKDKLTQILENSSKKED